jgi:hypothetical protein
LTSLTAPLILTATDPTSRHMTNEEAMSGQYAPPPVPDPQLVESLSLSVRRNRPGHWAWDLKDSRDGSWFESMFEFDSEDQARRSGLSRIAELSRSVRGATAASRSVGDKRGHLVIVSRHDDELYAQLKRAHGMSDGIEVIRDRRQSAEKMDRRDIDRRFTDITADLRARGWSIVCRSEHGSRRSQESA